MSGMAEVLAEHQLSLAWENGDERAITCLCGMDIPTEQERGEIDMTFLAAHQAEAMSSVGFGPVKEAQREAWAEGHESGFWNGRESAGHHEMRYVGLEHAQLNNPYR